MILKKLILSTRISVSNSSSITFGAAESNCHKDNNYKPYDHSAALKCIRMAALLSPITIRKLDGHGT